MEADMSLSIARAGASALHGLGARALRAIAIAVLTVGLQVPALVAAGGPSETWAALAAPAPIVAAVADVCEDATAPLQNDDGEDRFDEGDDEFDCRDLDDRDDPCDDDDEDDCASGDEEAGCANYDDGNDRCLDEGEGRLDEGDGEFDVLCPGSRGCEQPNPTGVIPDASPANASSDPAGAMALAGLISLGAGSVWLLRRGNR
jgi:hypothetical protein